MELSLTGLRVLREVADRGTFSAAAVALGYTQSAVSRQIASLERATRVPLFARHPGGVRPTAAGQALLRHAAVILDELQEAAREMAGLPVEDGHVRFGAFASFGAVLLPRALETLRRNHPRIQVDTREAATPALVRALRAGTLELAVLAFAPPFRAPEGSPALMLETLRESTLLVGVPADHELARHDTVRVADLRGQAWIASRNSGDDTPLGAWPGLGEQPRIAHVTRDWLTKLNLVKAGFGLTTVPASLASAVPDGIRLLQVEDGPRERRRMMLGRRPGPLSPAAEHLRQAIRAVATD
jgi:DNA-binding transcriptional LysR family regulator